MTQYPGAPWHFPTARQPVPQLFQTLAPSANTARGVGVGDTLLLQIQRIVSGTSDPASLRVQRFSGPRCQEKPRSTACCAERGDRSGRLILLQEGDLPLSSVPQVQARGPWRPQHVAFLHVHMAHGVGDVRGWCGQQQWVVGAAGA